MTNRVLGPNGFRLLTEQCATCIFRPGNLMHLRPGRLRELTRETVAGDGYIVCHSTLPGAAADDVKPAICRGFANRYSTNALRVFERLGFEDVPPPPAER
jgi:hypothetical protein